LAFNYEKFKGQEPTSNEEETQNDDEW
jgi:hypothetical protein